MLSPMAAAYKELHERFEQLKRTSQRPKTADDKLNLQAALKEHFDGMCNRIDEQLASVSRETDEPDWLRLIAMKTSLIYEDAKIQLTMEEYEASKEKLESSLVVLKGIELHPYVAYLYTRVMNHLAFTHSKLEDYISAKETLLTVTQQTIPPNAMIYNTEQLFSGEMDINEDARQRIHSIRVNNLQMLCWVYGKLALDTESVLTQHEILKLDLDSGDCDPVDWGMRCTRMASLYLIRGHFAAARYYLCAAGSAFNRVEAAMLPHPELGKGQAELARGWIYYGLRLFDLSRTKDVEQLSDSIFEEGAHPGDAAQSPRRLNVDEEVLSETLKFPEPLVTLVNVPVEPIADVQQARLLFQHTQMWLKRARVFYTLRDHPFVYVNCVLDLSELHRFLAFYETDLEVQYSVQKRRADALETLSTILKEVRPQCYIAVSVELLRELAEVQMELMGINLKKMCKLHEKSVGGADDMKHRMKMVCDIQAKLSRVSNGLAQEISAAETEVVGAESEEADEADANQVDSAM